MKSLLSSLAALILAASCVAQTALVVPLKPEDSAHIRQLHQAMLDAEQAWKDAQADITRRYLIVDKGDPAAGHEEWYPDSVWLASGTSGIYLSNIDSYPRCQTEEEKKELAAAQAKWNEEELRRSKEREAKSRRWRKGWTASTQLEFSEDFQFVVPKPPAPSTLVGPMRYDWAPTARNLDGLVITQ